MAFDSNRKYPPRFAVPLLWILSGGLLPAASDPLQIVDLQGRVMTARLVTSDGTTVTFTRESDKKSFNVPLDTLDETTRGIVRNWITKGGSMSEKYEISVDTGRTSRTTGRDDFDDKRVNLNPVIAVKNPDTRFVTRDGKVTVLFFGRPVDNNSNLHVFGTQTFDLPKLDPLKTSVFEMKKMSAAYDNRGYAKFGARYLGYAVFIHDGPEKVYQSHSVPAALANAYGPRLLGLKGNTTYNKNLD